MPNPGGPFYEALGRELVRALRGRRSQRALSNKLGYSTNAVYTWEAGSAWPTAVRFFQLARHVGVDPDRAVSQFLRGPRSESGGSRSTRVPLDSEEGVRRLLVELRGRTPVNALAHSTGLSRCSISRWLHGRVQPKLPDFLCYLEQASLRLLDFVATFSDPEGLPSVRERWRSLQAARAVGYELPIAHAVLRALEVESYRAQKRHEPGFLAKRLGISRELEAECLAKLAESGQIKKRKGLWEPVRIELVDFRRDASARQRLKAFWAGLAAERTRVERPGLFAYNVFAVSRKDLARLEALQREYLSQMRTIIAASDPSEVVALSNLQLFALED